MKKTSGFTLIELAIVLVIIGLLLGGVLKGQELINSAKAKSMANDFKNTQILLYAYQDKFRALPGDDANVANHVTNGVLATAGTQGNARIEGQWNSENIAEESYLFWQHVRLAGLASGSTVIGDQAYIPRNADGGRLGIQSINGFNTITDAGVNAMVGAFVVCSGGVVGRLAKQIDVLLDDGVTNSGNVRVVVDGVPGPSLPNANVPDGNMFTVCMSF
ncbi:prepilin-type N-terminal cleavage/methylation domain-containing protein [Methylobacillus flagellatus]|uniref:prepilin-type N-terminal cleavage/methylation domain-containing protein n=1 Tax=Methylobacillus flagellatus TaxID=405 RepID=UPI002853EF0A|nr:prepilin-type N-terminal cleavage/methylation domain-containing protein [Methylobacillus flagellatus]MDR5170255.1 prepilin-type N-terminal cleavage/methylation domain-containing protein [Methylobacillus flagellatus]